MKYEKEKVKIGEKEVFAKHCTKFNPFYRGYSDGRRAVVYHKLIEDGCPKRKAVLYCSKAYCKTDTTKEYYGPSGYSTLKLKVNPFMTTRGWQYSNPTFELGKDFYQSPEDFLTEDDQENMLQKQFIENEDRYRMEFKKKVKQLAQYYKELNDEFGFSGLEEKDLLEKVKNCNTKVLNDRKRKRNYLRLKNIKLYQMGDKLADEKNSPFRANVINKMNVFPLVENIMCTEEGKNIKFVQESSSESDEYFDEDPDSVHQEKSRFIRTFNSDKMASLKSKTSMFYALEAQTQFLNNITNMEAVIDYSHLTPNEARLLKINPNPGKKSAANITNSDEMPKNTISMETLDITAKRFIESEFNHSKYLTIKGEEMKRASKVFKSMRTSVATQGSVATLDAQSPRHRTKTELEDIEEELMKEKQKELEEKNFQSKLQGFIKQHIEKINSTKKLEKVDDQALKELKKRKRRMAQTFFKRSVEAPPQHHEKKVTLTKRVYETPEERRKVKTSQSTSRLPLGSTRDTWRINTNSIDENAFPKKSEEKIAQRVNTEDGGILKKIPLDEKLAISEERSSPMKKTDIKRASKTMTNLKVAIPGRPRGLQWKRQDYKDEKQHVDNRDNVMALQTERYGLLSLKVYEENQSKRMSQPNPSPKKVTSPTLKLYRKSKRTSTPKETEYPSLKQII